MRFTAEHRFSGSPASVAAVLSDPEFYTTLDLPDLAFPVLLETSKNGERTRLVFRYEFVGSLDSMARRLLGSHRLTWRQEVVVDSDGQFGDLSFSADADPKRLHGDAHFVLTGDDHGFTTRTLHGEIVVAVPLIGSAAEKRIVPGLVRRLDMEADAVQQRLQGQAG